MHHKRQSVDSSSLHTWRSLDCPGFLFVRDLLVCLEGLGCLVVGHLIFYLGLHYILGHALTFGNRCCCLGCVVWCRLGCSVEYGNMFQLLELCWRAQQKLAYSWLEHSRPHNLKPEHSRHCSVNASGVGSSVMPWRPNCPLLCGYGSSSIYNSSFGPSCASWRNGWVAEGSLLTGPGRSLCHSGTFRSSLKCASASSGWIRCTPRFLHWLWWSFDTLR